MSLNKNSLKNLNKSNIIQFNEAYLNTIPAKYKHMVKDFYKTATGSWMIDLNDGYSTSYGTNYIECKYKRDCIWELINEVTPDIISTKIEESSGSSIIGYRSIGVDELKLLLEGQDILGSYDSTDEIQTTIKEKNIVMFFTDPIFWKDRYHKVLIKCTFNNSEIVATGKGQYFGDDGVTTKGIWNGKIGDYDYYLNEFAVSKYNLNNLDSFIDPKSVAKVVQDKLPELYDTFVNLNKNGANLSAIRNKNLKPKRKVYYYVKYNPGYVYKWICMEIFLTDDEVEEVKSKLLYFSSNQAEVKQKAKEMCDNEVKPEDIDKQYDINYESDRYKRGINDKYLNESKKLEEASRNELLALTKSQTITRYNKAAGYKGFSIVDIDTSMLLRDDTITVTCRVGDYYDTVQLMDILIWIQMEAERNENNQVNTKNITQALMEAIDALEIKVNCTCGDWQYRFAYQATVLDYKYGKPENRPAKITNPNNYGALCKHLTSMLSNKKWLQQVTGSIMDWMVKHIDEVNKYLRVKEGQELTLPNELARQNAKIGFYSKLFKDKLEDEPKEEVEDNDNNVDNDSIDSNDDNVEDIQDNNEDNSNDNNDNTSNDMDNITIEEEETDNE